MRPSPRFQHASIARSERSNMRNYVANSSAPALSPKWKPPSSSYPTGTMEFRICCQGAAMKHLKLCAADEVVVVGAGEGVELSGWTSFWMMRGSLIFQIFRSTRGKIKNFANRCLYVVKDFVIFFMGNHTHIKILEFTNP